MIINHHNCPHPQSPSALLRDGAALHWLPFHAQCPPCHPSFKPQAILKYQDQDDSDDISDEDACNRTTRHILIIIEQDGDLASGHPTSSRLHKLVQVVALKSLSISRPTR